MTLHLECADELLSTTRAVRKRLDLTRPVPRQVILDCIGLAQQAPTGGNQQSWRWLVVTDAAKRAALADLYRGAGADYFHKARDRAEATGQAQAARVYDSAQYLADHMHEVPVLVVPCLVGRPPEGGGARVGGFFASIYPAVWSFNLALRARGLGTVLTTLHLLREKEAAAILGIPDDVTQAALLPVAFTIGDTFKPSQRPRPGNHHLLGPVGAGLRRPDTRGAPWEIADAAPDPAVPTWRRLPHVLVVAFLIRAAFALACPTSAHSDEVFQYLEQAHRLAFGRGVIPWEYQYGVRSWIIPGGIALVLKGLAALGLGRPDVYQPIIKLLFCAISLSLPLSVYRITRALLDESAARLALLGAAVSYELVFFAHTPMPDALAAYALFGALAALFAGPTRHGALAFGALAGLTLALRFQLAPMVAVAMMVAAWRWRLRAWPALVAFALVIILAGALDAYTWGRWFSSIVSNLELNLLSNVADTFGRQPGYYYLLQLAMLTGGLAYLGAAGLAVSWRATWPLLVMGLAELAALSAIGHKEPRFVLVLSPLYLIGLAALVANNGGRLRGLAPSLARHAPVAGRAMIVAFAALSVIGMGTVIGIGLGSHRNDIRLAYRMLSRRADVRGVIDDSGANWWDTGGYYDLHQPAPLYRPDLPLTNIARVRRSPALFASHWLTPATAAGPEGYVLLQRIGKIAIWRRRHDPPQTMVAPGYSTKAPTPFDSAAIPPKVTPRW
jgi:nitroreductase